MGLGLQTTEVQFSMLLFTISVQIQRLTNIPNVSVTGYLTCTWNVFPCTIGLYSNLFLSLCMVVVGRIRQLPAGSDFAETSTKDQFCRNSSIFNLNSGCIAMHSGPPINARIRRPCQRCWLNMFQPTLRKHAYSNILKILPPKKWKISDKKFWYFSYFCSKHKLWVLVRTASTRRF